MASGFGSTAAYQVSGFSYITASFLTTSIDYMRIQFPRVAKRIVVTNIPADFVFPYKLTGSCPILVFFGPGDLTGTYPPYQVTQNHARTIPSASATSSLSFDVRTSQVFISKKYAGTFGAFEVYAELTTVDPAEIATNAVVAGVTQSFAAGVFTGTGIDWY